MLIQAASEMRTFLERCADGQSMDDMFNAMQRMKEDALGDEELGDWWERVDAFVRKVEYRSTPPDALPSDHSVDTPRAWVHPCSHVRQSVSPATGSRSSIL